MQSFKGSGLSVVLTLSVAVMMPTAAEAFATFTDRPAFDTAATADGAVLSSEDFNSVVTDQSFQVADGPKTVGALTFAETGPGTAGSGNGQPNRIDADSSEFSGVLSPDDPDTSYVFLSANADDSPTSVYGALLTFAAPVQSFGADYRDFISEDPGERFRLTLIGSMTAASFLLPEPPSSSTNFFGIVGDATESFTGIAFSAEEPVPSRRATVGLDNASFTLIPEPATAGLLIAGLGLIARRRVHPGL